MKNKKIVLVLFLTFLGGCSLWENFTAYFNTYYNASVAFEQAQQAMNKNKPPLFEFKLKKIPSSANKSFDDVIKKCSRILQFHSKSSYFDKSLFMLGRAFYYKQQFSKALRKFQELATIKNTDLALKNKLWIGKTQLQLREYAKGMKILEDVKSKAIKNEEDEIASEALISEIQFLLYKENISDAIQKINELIEVAKSDPLKAEATYELGKLYEQKGDKKGALKAFANVLNFEPTYEIEFDSRLEYAKLKKEMGDEEGSLKLLKMLSNENKFADMLGKVDLQIANIYLDKGQIEDAISLYTDIDTTYKKSESAGIADFKLGQIMENTYNDYDSAMYYYKKCLSSKALTDVKIQAKERNRLLSSYLKLRGKLSQQMKKLEYLTDPKSFVRDSLIYADYKHKQDSIAEANKNKFTRGRTRTPGSGYAAANTFQKNKKTITKPRRPTLSADSLKSLISDTEFELGNLFFGDLNVLDSAYYYYSSSLVNKPNNPNKPKILYAMGNYYLMIGDTLKADSLFNYIYDNYKYDRIVNEAAKIIGKKQIDFESDPAEKVYLKAEKKYLASDYSGAIKEFLTIPKNFPNSPFAPQALYTTGFILENNLSLPDSAAAVYDSLVTKYRATPYTKAVRPELNFYKRQLKAIQDSIKKAHEDSLKALLPPDSLKAKVDSVKKKKKVLEPEIIKNRERMLKKKGRGKMLQNPLLFEKEPKKKKETEKQPRSEEPQRSAALLGSPKVNLG